MINNVYRILFFCVIAFSIIASPSAAKELLLTSSIQITDNHSDQTGPVLYADASEDSVDAVDEEEDLDYLEEVEPLDEISDPLEPLNRVFFHFNDKLYLWVLEPVARGYSKVIPENARISVRNFFNNIATPIRFVNNVLQFKMKPAGNELARFGLNTTFGVLGLFDWAKDHADISMQDEDLGQTFGVWGAGPGFYLNLPFIGPSSLRDTVGYIGDSFLDPVSYVKPSIDRIAIKAGDQVNRTSLRLGDYEEIKKDAIDPYSAFRDIYYQYRKEKIDK